MVARGLIRPIVLHIKHGNTNNNTKTSINQNILQVMRCIRRTGCKTELNNKDTRYI